jgi:DNA polymerase III delta subunit
MIYIFHGTDTDKSRVEAQKYVADFCSKDPEAAFFKMSADDWQPSLLDEYTKGQGLFSPKFIIYLDRLCDDKSIKEEFVKFIDDMASSENTFVVVEGKLDKATLTKFEKKAEKVTLAERKKEDKEASYNTFAIADALARRDKKNMWILYRESIDRGESPEALHGILFWKAKTMALSPNQFSTKWSKEDIDKLLDVLIDVSHQARRGRHEMETGMESVLLRI